MQSEPHSNCQRVAVLMTCYNRVSKTLSCLESLFSADLPDKYHLQVYLVDDGSTDGTGSVVKARYPDVFVIEGAGDLFWSGGMRLAWSEAARNSYDFYVWLNDDTFVFSDALTVLLESAERTFGKAVVCGTVISRDSGKVTYGGKMKNSSVYHVPSGDLVECEIINGNCVLIPSYVFKKIGFIDPVFRHAIGDFDYGLRAVKAGIKCFVAPRVLGNCEANPNPPKWVRSDVRFVERLRSLYSPLGYAQPWPYFVYVSRHFGYISAFRQVFAMHVRVAFPRLWKSK